MAFKVDSDIVDNYDYSVGAHFDGNWFYVWAEGNGLYVANSKSHTPSSKIQGRRRLNPSECDTLLDLYKRRCRGEAVSKQAIAATVNQVYWYGIFHALGL